MLYKHKDLSYIIIEIQYFWFFKNIIFVVKISYLYLLSKFVYFCGRHVYDFLAKCLLLTAPVNSLDHSGCAVMNDSLVYFWQLWPSTWVWEKLILDHALTLFAHFYFFFFFLALPSHPLHRPMRYDFGEHIWLCYMTIPSKFSILNSRKQVFIIVYLFNDDKIDFFHF